MRILVLSTGVYNRRYGQQRYEFNFLNFCFRQKPYNYFRVILLNDYEIPPSWSTFNHRLKFVLCGRKIRFISKIKFVLSSFWWSIKERPDYVICGHINLSVLCLIISRLFKLKYLILTHGTDVWDLKNRLKLKALSYAHKIISVSRYTASKIERQNPHAKNKIIVLPNAVDVFKFAPDKKSISLVKEYNLDGYKSILTVARFDYADQNKGYDKVLAALPEVMKIVPRLKYILVGEGSDIPRISRLIKRLGLAEHIVLAGYVQDEDLAHYYNLCDCFVMPSKQEGFGIVFLEALACGKPVIAGNRDGSRDALLDGKLGVLVDPDNITEITQAIINILQGQVSKHLLDGVYLRKMVIEYFSLDKFSERVQALIREL